MPEWQDFNLWDERIQLLCACDSSYEQSEHQALQHPFDA